jgi:anaerobic selenocysteine-containing dehydrogenase
MSRRVAGLNALAPEAIVEIHPADGARLGIATRRSVRVSSRRGGVTARAKLVAGIARGTVFLPFHFAEAAANELTIGALDPLAKIPEYKVCAVTLERLDEPARPAARSLREEPSRRRAEAPAPHWGAGVATSNRRHA